MTFTPDQWVLKKGDVSLPLHVTYYPEATAVRLVGEDGEDVTYSLTDPNHVVLEKATRCVYERAGPAR